jgi:hypothetical protein
VRSSTSSTVKMLVGFVVPTATGAALFVRTVWRKYRNRSPSVGLTRTRSSTRVGRAAMVAMSSLRVPIPMPIEPVSRSAFRPVAPVVLDAARSNADPMRVRSSGPPAERPEAR